MIDLLELQKLIYANKVKRKFNVTDIHEEVSHIAEELGELSKAYRKQDHEAMVDEVGDITVFCLGLFEILQVNSEEVLKEVVRRNETRTHVDDGLRG